MYLLGRAWLGIHEGAPRRSVLHVFDSPLFVAFRLAERGSLGLCVTGHLSGDMTPNAFPCRLAYAEIWIRFPLFCEWVQRQVRLLPETRRFEEWLSKDSSESDSAPPSPVAVRSRE